MRTDFPKEKALVGQPCSRYGPTSGSTWEVQIGFYGLQKKLEGGVGEYEILKKKIVKLFLICKESSLS